MFIMKNFSMRENICMNNLWHLVYDENFVNVKNDNLQNKNPWVKIKYRPNVGSRVLLGIRIKFGDFNLAICCFTLPIRQIKFLTIFSHYTVGSP